MVTRVLSVRIRCYCEPKVLYYADTPYLVDCEHLKHALLETALPHADIVLDCYPCCDFYDPDNVLKYPDKQLLLNK